MEKSLEIGQDGSATRRTRIGDIRRDELTAAALRCIAAKGYDRVTLEDVAREAGSSQGNVLYYFKNREALMMSTANRIGEDMMDTPGHMKSREDAVRRKPCWASMTPVWRSRSLPYSQ